MLQSGTATPKDRNFITGCILAGARKGRFSVDVCNPGSVKNMKAEVNAILTGNHTLQGAPSHAVVYTLNGKRVGFTIVNCLSSECIELELYTMAVAPGYRGRGYGSWIVRDVLNRYEYQRFYARCSGNSPVMRCMLERHKFRMIDTNEQGYFILQLDHEAA